MALALGTAHAAEPAEVELAPECPPFEATPLAASAPLHELGIAPSRGPEGRGLAQLPTAALSPASARRGEALVALPKRADGKVGADLELGPGARIAGSYFSPILCSTVVRVVGPPDADADALVRRSPAGSAVVRNDVYRTAAPEVRPVGSRGPDPYRDLQYGLDQAKVDAARAVTDGAGARVALLDSRPDAAHRELTAVRIRLLDPDPTGTAAAHGSILAGIVDAIEDNAFGIAGVAPGAELIAIPVCTPDGESASDACALSDLLRGVDVAWEERAQIVNLSLVGPANPLLQRAMDRLDQLGVVLVAAVGNESSDEPRYPAAYPSVIGVGAVDRDGKPYARGNRGNAVEVLAPGVEIVSSVPGDAFAFGDGTSLAAAHVTGLLALAIAASGDPLAARTAFFQAAREIGGTPVGVPPICEVLARLGKPCP
jgi:subtilisin family serine protease